MRFMYDYNEILDVDTIESTEGSTCWNPQEGETKENPGHFFVTLHRPGWMDCKGTEDEMLLYEINGEYNLDGTEETYKRAVENYNGICGQLLEKGYCKASDSENFTWF